LAPGKGFEPHAGISEKTMTFSIVSVILRESRRASDATDGGRGEVRFRYPESAACFT
jgi:hypothetical protein